MKTKILINNPEKLIIEYPELPFIILSENNINSPCMLIKEKTNEKIRCLSLKTGEIYGDSFETLNDYFVAYPFDRIVKSEINLNL